MARRLLLMAVPLVLAAGLLSERPAMGGIVLPAGFQDQLVVLVPAPTALGFTPDGRMLIASQTGALHVYQDGSLLKTPALDLGGRVCADRERGLLGIAVDPEFGSNGHIYLYSTFKAYGGCGYASPEAPVNRVSRFSLLEDGVVDPESEDVLLDNIPSPSGFHNGGDLQFGPDGYLYVSVGDGGCDVERPGDCGIANGNARRQDLPLGKVLRITASGGVPKSNPFLGANSARCNRTGRTEAGMMCRETFAWGLRNPFRIAFDPNAAGARFFINDVGQERWEEVDLGEAGADYGWNLREGPCEAASAAMECGPAPAGMTDPVFSYEHASTGCFVLTGGAFVPTGAWPPQYDGAYLFADYGCGKIFRLSPAPGGGYAAEEFVAELGRRSAVVMEFGPHEEGQALYYTSYTLGGQVRRIHYEGR